MQASWLIRLENWSIIVTINIHMKYRLKLWVAVQECRCDNKTQSKVIYPPIGEYGKAECMKWWSEENLYDCTAPFGSGLSSSAAIEVATAYALAKLGGNKIDKVRLSTRSAADGWILPSSLGRGRAIINHRSGIGEIRCLSLDKLEKKLYNDCEVFAIANKFRVLKVRNGE